MTIHGCMQVASQVAARSDVPLILMGHYNPVLAYGIERFCQAAAASGVSGLIIPDLPLKRRFPYSRQHNKMGLYSFSLCPLPPPMNA